MVSSLIAVRPVNRGGKMTHGSITEQAIYNIVAESAERLGIGKSAPHESPDVCRARTQRRIDTRSDSTLPGPRLDPNYRALPGR